MSSEDTDTYTMCLKKKTFLELLEKFPSAKNFFEKKGRERRIEIRRVRKFIFCNPFILQIKKTFCQQFKIGSDSEEEDKLYRQAKEQGQVTTYTNARLPKFLDDPDYYFNHPLQIPNEDLIKSSDGENPNGQAIQDEAKQSNKKKTNMILNNLIKQIQETNKVLENLKDSMR